MGILNLLCIFGFIYCTSAASLPAFLKQCHRSDPNLNDCARDSANNGMAEFIKGDEKLKIPVLSPFKVDSLTLAATNTLNITLTDILVQGIETTKVNTLDIDLEKKHMMIIMNFEKLNLQFTYEISGKILILPITGKGPGNITVVRPDVTYEFDYDLVERKGNEYMKIKNTKLALVEEKVHFELENLFNGDARLGPEMNTFLNENWNEVAKEVQPAINEAVDAIATSVIIRYFGKIPFDNVFPL